MAFIFLISDQPRDGGIIPDFGIADYLVKKSAHFLEYGLLAWLLQRAVRGAAAINWRQAGWVLLLTILYSVTDEYHQTFVPGRTGRWQDVVIDAAGAVTALALTRLLRQRKAKASL